MGYTNKRLEDRIETLRKERELVNKQHDELVKSFQENQNFLVTKANCLDGAIEALQEELSEQEKEYESNNKTSILPKNEDKGDD